MVRKSCDSWKSQKKWEIYIDFTNLNNACRKDYFPLPRCNTLIDSTIRYMMSTFMDDLMVRKRSKCLISYDVYYYSVMTFVLKNAWFIKF